MNLFSNENFTLRQLKILKNSSKTDIFRNYQNYLEVAITKVLFTGKNGFGNTKFIAFEKLAWHYECFICALCKASMVGKGFIQDEDDIICPECARKKMLEEMEAEYQE